MNPLDVALQSTMPTIMVPRFEKLDELSVPGNRILIASNGIWLEVCRPWLYARILVGDQMVTVPYGEVTEELRLTFGKLPRALVREFIELARTRSPNECAAWGVWNAHTDTWRLQMLQETSVGHAHVAMDLPVLGDDEHMVLDLHSHGLLEAFFSPEDNDDDRGECKIAGVVGNLDQETVTTAFRFCANSMFTPLQAL